MRMDRERLLAELAAAGHHHGDAVFVERCGDDYRWELLPPGQVPSLDPGRRPGRGPDAWMVYSGSWPASGAGDMPGFLADLLAEMESMCGGTDRCRWPLDEPYPAGH
jgi:hypothetical protein